jgi:hypothetical protein
MPIECVVLFELHKLCTTFSASLCINYRLPIKVYYRICTLRHIRIEINHGSQNVILSFNMDWRILVNFIPRFLLGIKYEYPPIHIKTPNTFWLPWFISKNKYKVSIQKGQWSQRRILECENDRQTDRRQAMTKTHMTICHGMGTKMKIFVLNTYNKKMHYRLYIMIVTFQLCI